MSSWKVFGYFTKSGHIEVWNSLSKDFIENIEQYSHEEIAFEAIKQFVGDEIPETVLKEIIKETVSFDFPVVEIEENIGTLELFHGPTMALKTLVHVLWVHA